MKNIYLLSFASFFLLFSSFENPFPAPDPESFGKKVVEIVRTGDTSLYRKAFMLDHKLVKAMIDDILNDPYVRESMKDELKGVKDKAEEHAISKINKDVSEAIFIIEKWKKGENIRLDKLEYIKTYYEMEYEADEGICILDKAVIVVRYDSVYYSFNYNECLWAKEKFAGGDLYNISRLDSDFRQSEPRYSYYDDSRYDMAADTVAYEAAEIAVDTVWREVNEIEEIVPAAREIAIPQSKKEIKKQKKIDKLNKKLEKLYSE